MLTFLLTSWLLLVPTGIFLFLTGLTFEKDRLCIVGAIFICAFIVEAILLYIAFFICKLVVV